MKQPDDSLGMMVGYRLKQAQAALRTRMDDALRPLGLTTPQYACLELLSRTPGASNAELARGGFVTRQTMNTLLRGLEQRGLVERADEAPTGRALPTTLTPAGQRLLAKAVMEVGAVQARMVSTLTEGQAETLRQLLAQCAEALNAPETGS